MFFQHQNRTEDGINGGHVELRSFNDWYDPDHSLNHVTQVMQLMPDVFCFFGCVGTPTSQVIEPVITKNGIPFFAPFTGADFLRHDHSAASDKHYIVNVRSGYDEEVSALVDHVRRRGIDRISCLYQDDAYGQGVLSTVRERLRVHGLSLAGEAGYVRNTDNVAEAFRRIHLARPEAIVLAGVYAPCAAFIKMARDAGMDDCIFLCLSFVSSVALRNQLGRRYEDNVCISEVVPCPWDGSVPLVKEYQDAMGDGELSYESLKGYINAKVFTTIAQTSAGHVTRDVFMKNVDSMGAFDIGGVDFYYDATEHNGLLSSKTVTSSQ